MELVLTDIGKRFNTQWIFKGINHTFATHSASALVGNNGSGKSTLLQIIYGFQTHSRGKIEYHLNHQILLEEELPRTISFAAPYLELPEEFTLNEMLAFHFKMVPLLPDVNLKEVLDSCGLTGNEQKYIKHFSSGMKQRLKLILAFYSQTALLLLDEPCSNLDEKGIAWYKQLLKNAAGTRTIIIASNQPFEYEVCETMIDVTKFKN